MRRARFSRPRHAAWCIPIGVAITAHPGGASGQTVASPATAASASGAAAPVALESVTITAQKRPEKAQGVANAITVITDRDIERAGIANIQDAAALTPNLVIIDQLRPGIQTIAFRGFTTVQGGQSPFAIVVDGVPQPGQEFLKQNFVDVQQIEVLRGPQGTLYGAGAIAGAINIVTVPPSDQLQGHVKLGLAQGGQKTEAFSISGPLAAGVAWYRLGLNHIDENGQISNVTTGGKVDFSHETTLNGQLLFKPSAQLSIDLRANGTDGRNGALWLVPVTNANFDNFDAGPNTDIIGKDRRKLQTYSAKVDYAFDDLTLTSITAYNRADQFLFADGDFSPNPVAAQTWTHNTRAYSQEFRLTSTASGPLRWNVGAFYQHYSIDDITQFGALAADGTPVFDPSGDNITREVDRSAAVFGQASYDIGAFTLTGGLRYDAVKAHGSDPNTTFDDTHTFSEWQPKATLGYKITPALLAYGTYAKGFRTGGFNPNAPGVIRLYDNETADNYELGMKSSWLGDRLTVNGALFHTKFENQQYFYSVATSAGIYRVITNIPQTKVNGAEVEVQYRPVAWFKTSGSVGYNHAGISSFDTGQYDGNRVPQVYGLTSNLGLEAQQQIGDGLVVGRIDWNHRGEVYWDLANQLRTPPKNFFNARIAYQSTYRGSDWQVALVGRNLTNERTPAAVGANALGPGTSLRSANEPRQIGVEFQAGF